MITATYIVQNINKHLKLPINIMGLIMRYNGIDVQQTKHYIKIHCGKYIGKMTQAHLWLTTMPASHRMPLPFSSDKKTLAELLNCQTPATYQERLELERRMGIKYHHAMGDILYPMIKCHPDISAHVILLSQYMANGEPHHYLALKQLIQYLSVTADVGIHYWRKAPHSPLPEAPLPSSHTLLQDIGIEQHDATVLFEDNAGALLMVNTQQPTRRTRHIDIKHFTLLDWVERDLLVLDAIPTHNNTVDAMTKTLSRQQFYRHFDTCMGVRIPDNCTGSNNAQDSHTLHQPLQCKCNPNATVERMVQSMGGGTGRTYR